MFVRLTRFIALLLSFSLFGTQLALASPMEAQPFIALSTSADTAAPAPRSNSEQAPPQQATAQQQPAPIQQMSPASAPAAAPTAAIAPSTLIAQAHTVYLANTGGDPNFPLDQTIAYQKIYTALQSWGRFQLVGSPAQADLVFNLYSESPVAGYYRADHVTSPLYSPAFELTIVDPKTNQPVWTIDSPVNLAGSGKTYDGWVSVAIMNLVSRVKVVSGGVLTATENTNLTNAPKTHYELEGWLIGGGILTLGVVGGVLIHHAYENALADQKAQADQWCTANHVPISECPGG
jgi:hypothetical protein